MLTLIAAGCGSATGTGAGTASDAPISHHVPPGTQPPTTGRPTLVRPRPGSDSGRPVSPVRLEAGVGADGQAWARASWWGGIPSCYVLRPVGIHRTGDTIVLALREGSDALPGTVCADIAMLKAVRIDLGRLPKGSYVVRAGGRRATLEVA
jgi:hypothetical protein